MNAAPEVIPTVTTPSPSDTIALRTDGLGFRVGAAVIVGDVSMEIPTGEFVGVIGPNGAGKTSFLNLLSGVIRSTSGRAQFEGVDITRKSVHARARLGISRTFQTSYLLLGLSVLENVRLMAQAKNVGGLRLLGPVRRTDSTTETARAALDRVGLSDRADTLVGSLSHGDRRKVELAIVLAADARLVLLDEPMAGVNSEDVEQLTELIRDLHRESGSTFIMVEHHLHVVLGLAHRVAVMHEGSLLAFDAPESVMSDPRVQTAYVGEEL